MLRRFSAAAVRLFALVPLLAFGLLLWLPSPALAMSFPVEADAAALFARIALGGAVLIAFVAGGWLLSASRYRLAALLAAPIAILLVLHAGTAFAQEAASTVAVPIGDWIGKSSGIIGSLLGVLVIWLFRQLPAGIVQILRTMQVEQLLDKAITYGINAVAGASKDKVLTVNVGNAVIAQAAQYAIDHAPGWLIGWLGGETAIRQMIIARLNLEPVATIAPNGTRLMGNG
jgi:hypothetical protein